MPWHQNRQRPICCRSCLSRAIRSPSSARSPAIFRIRHRLCPCLGIGAFADQAQHGRDIRLIPRAHLVEFGTVLHIIIAIGHRDAALRDIDDIAFGRLFVLTHKHAEQATHALALQLGHFGRKRGFVRRPLQRGKPGLDGRDTARVNGRLIQIAGIKVTNLRPRLGSSFLKNGLGLRKAAVLQHVEHAKCRAVGRDFGLAQPAAARKSEKIVARLNAAVHAGGVKAIAANLGPICRGSGACLWRGSGFFRDRDSRQRCGRKQ